MKVFAKRRRESMKWKLLKRSIILSVMLSIIVLSMSGRFEKGIVNVGNGLVFVSLLVASLIIFYVDEKIKEKISH